MNTLKRYFSVMGLLLLSACTTANQKSSLVLDYEDFGPPSAAFEILGNDWWQWQTHGDSRPRKYDIKVVVFKNISQELLDRQYPTNKETEKDFRFIQYDAAMAYLNKTIEENVMPSLTEKLESTKEKLKDL